MRDNNLYANLKKCVFCAPKIPMLGYDVSNLRVRADPEKVMSIYSWPKLNNPTELRQWLVLANYLHKYTKDYAGSIQPISSLLRKDASWLASREWSGFWCNKDLGVRNFPRWSFRTTSSHFTWFAMQVILSSVVSSCKLALRAVSESRLIS